MTLLLAMHQFTTAGSTYGVYLYLSSWSSDAYSPMHYCVTLVCLPNA